MSLRRPIYDCELELRLLQSLLGARGEGEGGIVTHEEVATKEGGGIVDARSQGAIPTCVNRWLATPSPNKFSFFLIYMEYTGIYSI